MDEQTGQHLRGVCKHPEIETLVKSDVAMLRVAQISAISAAKMRH
ncbi:hypothetical protein [Erythrobacter sp. BLCC-B19]|nr:hypothetical protein [Erythrobacter sp. BLCC-B19]WDA41936.1 hypothetical protein PS060_03760 [Erythrobacter sp. BLCC-B19]